jgi:hypothetical protein
MLLMIASTEQFARADAATEDALADSVAALVAQQDERVREALSRIDGTGRRLLALRSYLRNHQDIEERWSWTQKQITAYEGSPEQRDLLQEIDRVRTAFAASNPGFELYVNPRVRSLDIQIEHWNINKSVATAADTLLASVLAFIASPGFPATPLERAKAELRRFLSEYTPVPTPTIAAPGLSRHGQMRDVDFQVHQDGRVAAGPNTATIARDWDAGGWAAKLDAAVRAASIRFTGPLASPREPWHYTYTPTAAAVQ